MQKTSVFQISEIPSSHCCNNKRFVPGCMFNTILHTEKGKNTSPQRSGNLHESSQTDTGQRPPERQENMGMEGSLDKKRHLPKGLTCQRGVLLDGDYGCSQKS